MLLIKRLYNSITIDEKYYLTFLLRKNHTRVKKVGHTSHFGIYWWTLKNQKNRILKKWKIITGDIIISYMCTKNHIHMRYSSWDMEWDRILCHFGPFFALLPPITQKTKILKKSKKHLKLVQQKKTIIWSMFTQIWGVIDKFLSF